MENGVPADVGKLVRLCWVSPVLAILCHISSMPRGPRSSHVSSFAASPLLSLDEAQILNFTRFLAVATNNLDFLRGKGTSTIQLEIDIFDQECPDIIAESVGIEMTLEVEARFHSFRQNFGNDAIEM